MPWYRCNFASRPLAESSVHPRFETLFMANRAPAEMLLIKQNHSSHVSTLSMRLPDAKLRSFFTEFEEVNEANLPMKAKLSVGHPAEFDKLFK